MRFVAVLLIVSAAFAQDPPSRPKILGVAHLAVFVKDLARTRQFYEDFLGFGEPFTLPTKDGSGVRIAFVKINDNQYLEIFTEPDRDEGPLNHISVYTGDADAMFAYLKARRAPIMGSAGKVPKGMTGNKNFNVKDPDGHIVELVEYQPDSWTSREKGKFTPSTRIADRIAHVGVVSANQDASTKFYAGVLGVPRDLVEFVSPGGQNHATLIVADLRKALAELQRRAAKGLYSKPLEIRSGRIALYDPDGTLIELTAGF